MTEDKDIQELLRRKERAITGMGGPDKIEAQHRRGASLHASASTRSLIPAVS
jgi:hypothetical protein